MPPERLRSDAEALRRTPRCVVIGAGSRAVLVVARQRRDDMTGRYVWRTI